MATLSMKTKHKPGRLVLNRKPGQFIQIGNNITVTVIEREQGGLRIAVDAPQNVLVLRGELYGNS